MEAVDPTRFVFAFLLVLGLIGLMAMALKFALASGRFTRILGTGAIRPQTGGRIEVLETRYIDARRRLVLVRRDHVQHLLLLADGRETVIESGIAEPLTAPGVSHV
jgi:hypothetical protein